MSEIFAGEFLWFQKITKFGEIVFALIEVNVFRAIEVNVNNFKQQKNDFYCQKLQV